MDDWTSEDVTYYTAKACRECGAPDSSGLCDECQWSRAILEQAILEQITEDDW